MTAGPVLFAELDRNELATPELDGSAVHLWSLELAAHPEEIARLGDLLAADERERAARYHFDRHRRRYIVGQGALRVLLGRYASLDPAALSFTYGPRGKPSLVEEPELHFNVSHSHERAVVAVARHGPLGVDIERRRELEDADSIAKRFFSAAEAAAYLEVPAERRLRAFFDCWTRKEAFVKALGEGLFLSLDRFDVSLAPGEPARVLAIDGDPERARRWSLAELSLADDFAGSLATEWEPGPIEAWYVATELVAGPGG